MLAPDTFCGVSKDDFILTHTTSATSGKFHMKLKNSISFTVSIRVRF